MATRKIAPRRNASRPASKPAAQSKYFTGAARVPQLPRPRGNRPEGEAEKAINRLRVALVLVALVTVCGTIGYMTITRMDFLSALYMTVITLATVGYLEVEPLGSAGRVFTMVLILVGVGSSFYTFVTMFEMLVSEQFHGWRRRQRMALHISEMKEHFLVCGYGRIGRQVASDMREAGVPVVVIDSDSQRCQQLLEENIPVVEGDATLDETLLEAGIEHAQGVVSVLNSDADNVMTVVTARGLSPHVFIVARAALPEAEKKLKRAGADEVISPYLVGAHRISLSLLRPGVSSFLNALLYGEGELEAEMTELVVEDDSPLVGQSLNEAGMAHEREVLPLALLRDGKVVFSPLPETVLQAQDILIIVTSTKVLDVARKGSEA